MTRPQFEIGDTTRRSAGVARTGEARAYYTRSDETLAVRLLVQANSMPAVSVEIQALPEAS